MDRDAIYDLIYYTKCVDLKKNNICKSVKMKYEPNINNIALFVLITLLNM